jgi:ribonuclease P protein subunit POP4
MTSTPTRQPASTTPTHPAHILLTRAHSPTTAAELFTTKIKQKPLLLRATSPPLASDNRALRRHIRLRKKEYFRRKQKPRPLSAKEKRILGVHELKKGECKYTIYEGLHRMWVGYMQEVLSLKPCSDGSNIVSANAHGSLLASADYHGAEVEVVRSGCVDRVGLKGIVVRDTKFTFVIVISKDEVKSEFGPAENLGLFLSAFCLDCALINRQRFPKRTPSSDSRYPFQTAPTRE